MGDDNRCAKLEARVEELERVVAALRAVFGGGVDVSDDRDLDSPRGDEKIRFDPRDWKGESHKGRTMSRSQPEFLDVYFDTMTYFASKQPDAKKAGFDKKTAARAAGWARRLRAGWTQPPVMEKPSYGKNGGFGPGTTSSWGSDGNSFGNGRRGFLGGAPPAATASEPDAEPTAGDDDFNFGANVGRPTAATTTTTVDDFDDDPPL